MGLREVKKERQRQAIIDAAVELFRERGFEATRVQDVAERLWISEGTFFNYFPTKQALLDAAVEQYLHEILDGLAHWDEHSPLLDRLEEQVGEAAVLFEGDRGFAALLAQNFQSALARGARRQAFAVLTRLFEEGQRQGEIRDDIPAGRLTETYLAVMLVTMSNSLLGSEAEVDDGASGEEPLDLRLRQAWAVLRRGIASDSARAGTPAAGKRRPSATRRTRSPMQA